MCKTARWSLLAAAAFGWGVVAVNAIPDLDALFTDGQVLLALGLGCMTVLVLLLLFVQRPVEAIWEAGREHGRREAMRELNRRRRAKVVRLDERRREHEPRRA